MREMLQKNWLALTALVVALLAFGRNHDVIRHIEGQPLMDAETFDRMEDDSDRRQKLLAAIADNSPLVAGAKDRELIELLAGEMYQLHIDISMIRDVLHYQPRGGQRTESE